MDITDAFSFIALAFVVKKLIDSVKLASGKQWGRLITQLLVLVAAVLVVYVASATTGFGAMRIGDIAINDFNWADKLWLGLVVGCLASGGADFVKALDNTDSAAFPALVPGVTNGQPTEPATPDYRESSAGI